MTAPVSTARTHPGSSNSSAVQNRESRKEAQGAADCQKNDAIAKSPTVSKDIANASTQGWDVAKAASAKAARTKLSARKNNRKRRSRPKRWSNLRSFRCSFPQSGVTGVWKISSVFTTDGVYYLCY